MVEKVDWYAKKNLKMKRASTQTAPTGLTGSVEVAWKTGNGVTGDLNQGMDSGGTVHLYSSSANV